MVRCSKCKEKVSRVDHFVGQCRNCRRRNKEATSSKRKTCRRCKKSLLLVSFWLCSARKDGYGHTCKDCVNDIERAGKVRMCKSCLEIKPLDDFHDQARYKFGKAAQCKKCRLGYSYRWRFKPENHKRRLLASRDIRRCKKYGMERGEFHRRIEEQNNKCSLCGLPFDHTKYGKQPRVDHCHATGKVRGVLHSSCNVLIGMAEESVGRLKKAIAYLRRFE